MFTPRGTVAERANIGRAKARAAIRLAEGLGLIAIEETPEARDSQPGRHVPLLSNAIEFHHTVTRLAADMRLAMNSRGDSLEKDRYSRLFKSPSMAARAHLTDCRDPFIYPCRATGSNAPRRGGARCGGLREGSPAVRAGSCRSSARPG